MSDLDRTPGLSVCGGTATVSARPAQEVLPGREVRLGESTMVRRLLPNLGRRLVGPWCFVDHYGPDDIASGTGMQVPPHPHMGLQTVSWLLDGQVRHRDSLGSSQLVRSGELGLMTAGSGIAHAEYSPVPHPSMLHGVQLWIALPDHARNVAATWAHHSILPTVVDDRRGMNVTVIMGELAGVTSPGASHSELVGADIALAPGAEASVPLEFEFEHAILVMSGEATVDGTSLAPGAMLYLGCARSDLRFSSERGARLLLLGGAPFEEQIIMWWNLIGRDHDEIVAAREQWMSGVRFGSVPDSGAPMPAPVLPPFPLKPGGRIR